MTYVNQDFLLDNNGNKTYTPMIHYGMEKNVIQMMDHVVLALWYGLMLWLIKTNNETTTEDIKLSVLGHLNEDSPLYIMKC